MLAALAASLVFTLVYATLAAKSRHLELALILILDVLQSVPVLGYISFTVVFFMSLFPSSQMGAELAAIFAIFTSQAWNMTFSFYQSLRTIPRDLDEACRSFHFSGWQRFWRLEVPFAMPGLIWNMMMSMSGAWFFVVASEAITVGDQQISLPGVGAYVAQAIVERDLKAVGWAILAMTMVIIFYDQLMFRPLVAWSDKFRFEQTGAQVAPESWVLDLLQSTRFLRHISRPIQNCAHFLSRARMVPKRLPDFGLSCISLPKIVITSFWSVVLLTLVAGSAISENTLNLIGHGWTKIGPMISIGLRAIILAVVLAVLATLVLKLMQADKLAPPKIIFNIVWYSAIAMLALYGGRQVIDYMTETLAWNDLLEVVWLGFSTLLRVIVLVVIATFIWVPLGVIIGLRPWMAEKIQPVAQFLAAFPANLLFGPTVIIITHFGLNPNIWLSPLMILSTQWYILFNVIAGAAAFPNDLKEAAINFQICGWQWWRKVILPGIFPYFITGAITAFGGAWNTSIVSEAVSWGDTQLHARGIGDYIARMTEVADFPRIVLGIAAMSMYVIVFNRSLWRPLYSFAERRLRLS
jgi:NitT/TauT family transport system permease protein